jgi:hypothetical protein
MSIYPKTDPERKEKMEGILRSILAKAQDFKNTETPYPGWLEKQIKAVHLMTSNFDRGALMLLDGLQDEDDALKTIEEEHGQTSEE